MATGRVWNSLEVAKLLTSLLTPLLVAVFGFVVTMHLKAQERAAAARETQRATHERQQLEKQHLDREDAKEELKRTYTRHIELTIDCQFLGARNGQVLAAITVVARNAGLVIHKFERIILRLRGIKDETFEYLSGQEPHVNFPHKIFETNLVPAKWNFIFIEPGVTQRLSLATLMSTEYQYVLVHLEFAYKEGWPHTAEALFPVRIQDGLAR